MRAKHTNKSEVETFKSEGGETTAFLLTSQDTDKRVTISESDLPAGNSAPWHYHDFDDEIFYIISGEVEFGVNEDVIVAKPGDIIMAGPKVHRRFTALKDSRFLVINAPGGPAEAFIKDIFSLDGNITQSDETRFATRYGIHLVKK
ncbi:cupin domain-containing protein [Curvivirga aplysinae]|uniref:cupin domain-containing protein n=1 Tax=Curvivirga aplysinae TaxID=2529852 RepID=UPI0012BBEBD1|nr:cupin domain-containing protein [Curvivirga aplysinae]MTI09543.1 cupin domain-containing protein [Curvivirga aplysinae]